MPDYWRFTYRSDSIGLAYFGYNVFKRGTFSAINANFVPINSDYIIGQGNIIRIIVLGEVEFQYVLDVKEDGM